MAIKCRAGSACRNFPLKPLPNVFALILLWCCLCLLAGLALGCGTGKSRRPDLRQEAVKLNDEGYKYYRESRWRLAQHKFTQALNLNRLIDHRPGIASNLNNLGAIAQEQGDLAAAATFYQEALTIRREIGDPAGVCEALNNLGTVYVGLGRWSEAQNLYLEALSYARQLPPGSLLALTLTHQGDIARHNQDYVSALNLYREALKIDQAKKNRAGMAVSWARLGRTYLVMGEYFSARRFFLMALRESRRLEMTTGIIDALDGLTTLALAQDYQSQAELYGGRLLRIYQARKQTQQAEKLREILRLGKKTGRE
jgi:tetratricopeptide (TPR) repeat protein